MSAWSNGVYAGTGTVANCTFNDNTGSYGAGMYILNGTSPVVKRTT